MRRNIEVYGSNGKHRQTYYWDDTEKRVKEVSINEKVDVITCCVCIGLLFVCMCFYMWSFS